MNKCRAVLNKMEKKYIFAPERKQYVQGQLTLQDIDTTSPFPTFHNWYQEAKNAGITADAVCLSTAELPSGRISSRMVLLKELDERGFVVYSNFGTSRKSKDLQSNPHASLMFWYEKMERSVRVEGFTERLSEAESQVYFDTRPIRSRLGAWASPQSQVITGREELDDALARTRKQFGIEDDNVDQYVPVPPFWGGLRIVPYRVEYWQGRNNRLHDRLALSRKDEDSSWQVERLAP